jgi:RNA polymerase sigma-70 factor (ECF subfamily)
MPPDAELVAAAVAGDRDAAAELIERHTAAVYAVCLGLLADRDRAEDIAQDALLKAIEGLATLRNPATFRSWLISIARNLCRDHWKLSQRRNQLLAEHLERTELQVVGGTTANPDPACGRATTSGVEKETAGPDLQLALARLPEKLRLPLLLYYFDGYSSARVGEALGISATGAGARLCRARQALRRILEVHND